MPQRLQPVLHVLMGSSHLITSLPTLGVSAAVTLAQQRTGRMLVLTKAPLLRQLTVRNACQLGCQMPASHLGWLGSGHLKVG